MLGWASANRVIVALKMEAMLRDGFGRGPDGEISRRVEGWLLDKTTVG